MQIEKPETLLRLPEVLLRFPVGKSTWWRGISQGKYPPPIKISSRCSAWRETDINALISELAEAPEAGSD